MIYKMIEAVATAADALFLIWFVPRFLHTRFYRKENLIALIVPAVSLAFQFFADRLLSGFDILAIIITVVLSVLYALLICKKKYFRAILAGGSYVIVIMLVSSLMYPLFALVFGEGVAVMQGAETPARVLYLAICRTVQFALYMLLLTVFRSDDSANGIIGVFFVCHTLVTVFGLFVLMTIAVNDTESKFTVPVMVLLSILIISNFGVYFLIRQLMKMQRREYEYKMMEQKMNAEKTRAEDADAIWENIKRFRHDMKNHFTVLKGKLGEGDVKACEEYIDEIYPSIERMGNLVHTGNAVIDYLINTKFPSDAGIQIIVSGFAGILDGIDDTDLASLLGNVLDNAFEAVRKIPDNKDRIIELHFLKKNQNRIIICKNTVSGPVLDENGKLKKTDKKGEHGYGHKIIASVTEKYGGFAEYIEQDGMLCVQIILPEQT